MKQERDISKAQNLRNTDPSLFYPIDTYNIKHQFLTEKVLDKEYALANTDAEKKRLIGKFRNKLIGFGKMNPDELVKLQEALLEMAKDIEHAVKESMAQRKLRRDKIIQEFLDEADEETIANILAEKKKKA